jgi:orotidine-5'-phosphate decarboxylase
LYMNVIERCITWSDQQTIGFVVGATHPNDLAAIRQVIPNHFLLIPGVGTQGGSIEDLMKANAGGPCLINVSRDIIYADSGNKYIDIVSARAKYYRDEFNKWNN